MTPQPYILPRGRIFSQNIESFWTFRSEPQRVKQRTIVAGCGKSVFFFPKEVTPCKIFSIYEGAHKCFLSHIILSRTDGAQD